MGALVIWLVDYTTYRQQVDPRLKAMRDDYFKIKAIKRARKIGPTRTPKTRTYATGALRLATILNANGFPTRYVHAYDLLDQLETCDEPPDVIAFSAVCPTVPACDSLRERINETFPDTRVMLGGSHVNVAYQQTLARYPGFDQIVHGYDMQAAGMIAGAECASDPRPFADYDLLPYGIENYAINVVTTTGCPFACSYCTDGLVPYLEASDDGSLGLLKDRLPRGTLVHFFDSVLGFSQERLLAICNRLASIDHGFLLSCDMRAELLSPRTLEALEQAGFVEIRLGIESADEEQLRHNNRFLMPDAFAKKLDMVRERTNLYVALYSASGLPGVTSRSFEATVGLLCGLLRDDMVDEVKSCMYVPYPRDGLDYETRGIHVVDHDWSHYDRQSFPVYETPLFSRSELWEMHLDSTQRINEAWAQSVGFSSPSDIPDGDSHPEYTSENYV